MFGGACGGHAAGNRIGLVARLLAPLITTALLWVAPAVAGAAQAQPVLAGSVSNSPTLSATVSVAVSGNYAYTTAYQNGTLTAVDILNPTSPQVVGQTAVANSLFGGDTVKIAGNYAYVMSKNRNASATSNDDGTGNSLTIVDISNPTTPTIVGTLHDSVNLFGAYGIAIASSNNGHTYAYVAAQGLLTGQPTMPDTSTGSLSVIDVTNPRAPFIVPGGHLDNGSLPSPWTGSNALEHVTSVSISGNYVYTTAFYSGKLTVINIANPASPTIVASLSDANISFPADVLVQGNYAYVADQISTGRIAVVDVSTPTNPLVVGSVANSTLNGAYRVRLRGSFAFVSGSSADAIAAIDISDPLHPRLAGSYADTTQLHRTTGLDVDSTGSYVIANSPYVVGQSSPNTPPFGPTTGTISAIQLDPQPIAVAITGQPPNHTMQTSATFSFSVNDAVSAVQCQLDSTPLGLCTGPPTSQTYAGLTPGTHTFTVQAMDPAGHTTSAGYTWTIDAVPPTVTISTPPNNASYAQGLTINAGYSCTAAAGTTLSSCVGTVPSGSPIDTTNTGPHTFTVTATDADGGSTTVSTTYAVTGPPSPTVTITSPPNGANYSQTHVVAAGYSCTAAAGTTLSSCLGPVTSGSPIDTSTIGPHTFTVKAIDADGGSTTTSTTYTVSSPAAPGVAIATPPNGATYTWNQTVDAFYSCTAAAGTTLGSCAGPVANSSPIDTSTTGSHTFTVTAADADGGTATASTTYTVLAAPAPSATLLTPAAGATYARGGRVLARYSCAAGAGTTLRSCIGTAATGAGISTGTLGTHVFTVTATQSDGQSATLTHRYRVLIRPTVSAFSEQHATWRISATPDPKHQKRPVGTTFSFRLSAPAKIRLAFYARVPGRKLHGACVAASSRSRPAPPCTRTISASGLMITGHTGFNRLTFDGRLSARRSLRPGAYRVLITAVGGGGLRSAPQALDFVIVNG